MKVITDNSPTKSGFLLFAAFGPKHRKNVKRIINYELGTGYRDPVDSCRQTIRKLEEANKRNCSDIKKNEQIAEEVHDQLELWYQNYSKYFGSPRLIKTVIPICNYVLSRRAADNTVPNDESPDATQKLIKHIKIFHKKQVQKV